MLEPTASPRLTVVALAAFCILLSACHGQAPAPAPPEKPKTQPPPAVVVAPPALDRAQLLKAMEDATASYAAGQPLDVKDLAGRQFTVRQAFGCTGPAADAQESGDGFASWSWGDDSHDKITLSLTPGDWTGSALIAGAAPDWEQVEGIWLTRPWLRAETCPGVQSDPLASGPLAPSAPTMGVASVFEKGGSRVERRNGRAYSTVLRGKDGQPPTAPDGGYRLVLEGRLASFADGSPIHCRAASPDQRPVCIVAAKMDRVAFEDAAGAVLAEWRPG